MSDESKKGVASWQPFSGGRGLMVGFGVIGLAGLGLTAVAIGLDPRRGFASYLLGYSYWVVLAVCSLLFVLIFNAAAAQWVTVMRRQVEHHASALVVLAVLFVPLALGMKHLYVWADETRVASLPEHTQHLLRHKHAWLNVSGFVLRSAIALAVFIGAWLLLERNSRAQAGRAPDLMLRSKTRGLSAGAIPFVAFALTAIGIDWLMTLEPEWFSAMFGVYYFAGGFVAAIALLTLTAVVPSDINLPAARLRLSHVHNLGTLLFAFTCFWAYIAFSQYMIIWHANLPEEASWLAARGLYNLARFHQVGEGPPPALASLGPVAEVGRHWFALSMFLFIGRFVLPFLALLSFYVKRSRTFLTVIAAWVLFTELVDLYWVIMPAQRLLGGSTTPSLVWSDVTAWLGVGGVCGAFVLWRMRGRAAVPVNDPTLAYSLEYRQP